jgi:alcohol dehydrogenase-like protein
VLSGYPHLEEAYWFGEGVLPLLRARGLWTHPHAAASRPQASPTGAAARAVAHRGTGAGAFRRREPGGLDWKTREGGGMAGVLGEPPFILGWDVSGVVEEVGFGVHTLEVGDEVYGMPWFPRQAGAYAEYVAAPSRQFARRPTGLDHDRAAAMPLAALTAWQSLVDAAHVGAGQRVLIHAAAGGVGHFAEQFAKHLGAHVIGTARAEKHDWLAERASRRACSPGCAGRRGSPRGTSGPRVSCRRGGRGTRRRPGSSGRVRACRR